MDPSENTDLSDAANEVGLGLAGQLRTADAEQWFRRASDATGDRLRAATLLLNRAHLYQELGDLDSATRLVAEALRLREALLGSESAEYGMALSQLGHLELMQGKATAVATLTKAYQTIEASRGEHSSLAEPLSDLATLYLQIGARDTAMAFAERALRIVRDAYGRGNPVLAPYLALLARCKAFAGELDVADALFRGSLECEPAAIENVRSFAYFLAARGEREAALLTIEHLIGLEGTLARELTSASAPERRRRAFFARLWNTVDAFLTLARPQDSRAAWELVVQRLGQDADQMRSERIAALRGAGRQVLQDLGVLRAQIARALSPATPA